ncbi:hypothetical protein Tco_0043988, partial [Tanacetum coccineum]
NSKKEKRVMRHSEIHKFCDAMLNKVLEGLKSYINDVKYDYVQRELTNDEVESLKLFEEDIEIKLEQLEVFNHVIQLIHNPIQCAITKLVHLIQSHHLLLIISVYVDYRPRLADYGVIFFEQKVRCIPIRLSKIEFRLITFNPKLQIFYTFSDDDVPYP